MVFRFNTIPVRHRLRSYSPEEVRWCSWSIGRWFGRSYHQETRRSFRLFFLQRRAIRQRQLGRWWRLHLPLGRGLLATPSCSERWRWMARHRTGRRLLHPDSTRGDLPLPWSSLPHFGSLLPQQMRSKVCLPPHAVFRPVRFLQRTLHRHLQAAVSLLLPHPRQGISINQRYPSPPCNCNRSISIHQMTI